MMSLFSSFDLYFFPMTMILTMYFLVLMVSKVQSFNIKVNTMNIALNMLSMFFLSLKMKKYNKMFLLYFCTLFVTVFTMNFTSVLPFNFPMTSQVSAVLMVSLTSWISLLLFQNFFSMKGFLSHCIPEGTPMYLVWLLFMIELISNAIRPITMAVRLMANILAGHLLMILLSQIILKLMWTSLAYFLLNLIELFVAFIQAYIFSTMVTLYYSEVN